MNGLKLASMPADDMLDVLHYFFEDDLTASSAEQSEARGKVRESLYRDLYHTEYKYARSGTNTVDASGTYLPKDFDSALNEEEEITPFDPLKKPTKAFIPATQFNPDAVKPFGNVLDAPFEH